MSYYVDWGCLFVYVVVWHGLILDKALRASDIKARNQLKRKDYGKIFGA